MSFVKPTLDEEYGTVNLGPRSSFAPASPTKKKWGMFLVLTDAYGRFHPSTLAWRPLIQPLCNARNGFRTIASHRPLSRWSGWSMPWNGLIASRAPVEISQPPRMRHIVCCLCHLEKRVDCGSANRGGIRDQ